MIGETTVVFFLCMAASNPAQLENRHAYDVCSPEAWTNTIEGPLRFQGQHIVTTKVVLSILNYPHSSHSRLTFLQDVYRSVL